MSLVFPFLFACLLVAYLITSYSFGVALYPADLAMGVPRARAMLHLVLSPVVVPWMALDVARSVARKPATEASDTRLELLSRNFQVSRNTQLAADDIHGGGAFQLRKHRVEGVRAPTIFVLDPPDVGGGHSWYVVIWSFEEPRAVAATPGSLLVRVVSVGFGVLELHWQVPGRERRLVALSSGVLIHFQEGPVPEDGPNGLTQEVLLAMTEHRLECFQAGPYACAENATALKATRNARRALQARTQDRLQRSVEGSNEA